jgi:hypothetical protein
MLSKGLSYNLSADEAELVRAIAELCEVRNVHVTVQWIPSHCGHEQNDHVDAMARDAVVEQYKSVSMEVMRQVIKLTVRKGWDEETDVKKGGISKDHIWTQATSGRVPRFPADPTLPRQEQRLLAQLRSGKSGVLGLYKKIWAKVQGAETCGKCGAIDDVHHFLACPFHAKLPREIFGTEMPEPKVLYEQQKAVIRYAEATGVWVRNQRTTRHQVAVVLCSCAAAILSHGMQK